MADGDDETERLRQETERLRQAFVRQTPAFDGATLPGRVTALVRRRQRLRLTLAIAVAAAVLAAVAIPLSSLRSAPLGRRITPATTPTTPPTPTSTPPTPTSTPPTPTPRAALAPFACDSLDLWSTPPGTPVSTSVSLGKVKATLSGSTMATPSQDPALSSPLLSISVTGGGSFSETVVPPDQANVVIPWSIAPLPSDGATTSQMPNSDALCLANSPGASLPTVLLGLDTGGAHCCTVVQAIAVTPIGVGPVVADDVGNPGASLSGDGDYSLIVTADNAFAYAFASYAASGMPVKVLELSQGGFVDVTKQHLDLVTKDSARWWAAFTANAGNGLGLLAPWVADECVLGQQSSAWATVEQLQAQGKLSGPTGWPTGAAYVQALRAFLAQHGYCPT